MKLFDLRCIVLFISIISGSRRIFLTVIDLRAEESRVYFVFQFIFVAIVFHCYVEVVFLGK